MDITNIRYQFEHNMLPMMFFTQKELFFRHAQNNPEVVFQTMEKLCMGGNMKIPYKEEDFKFELLDGYDGLTLMRLNLPEPERTPLCERIYFVTDEEWKKFGYYTVERGILGHSRLRGRYQSDGKPSKYGTCTPDTEIEKVLEAFNGRRI